MAPGRTAVVRSKVQAHSLPRNTVYADTRSRMVARMRRFFRLLLVGSALNAAAAPGDRVSIPPMKTSIYVGSVTLTTSEFARDRAVFAATYVAKVWPWFFWNETGRITITLPPADLLRLLAGETVEFNGEAFNHKNKPRHVTGRAQPAGAASATGKIKVRIGVDDTVLIFNGAYRIGDTP